MKVAVIAHAGKSLGGGPPRAASRPRGAGCGGSVAGTANLLAMNRGIPKDIENAVAIGLRGARRALDVGRFNEERFAVMAGAGFDAAMIRGADDGGLKDRFGRAAYVWSGSKSLRSKPFRAKIEVDGAPWYNGKASCILLGNVGKLFRVAAFEVARPDDGKLDLGVVTAEGIVEWGRMVARAAVGTAANSPFAQNDEGAHGQTEVEPQGALPARRGRPQEGQGVQGEGRAGRDHRLRPGRRGSDGESRRARHRVSELRGTA